MFDKKSQMGYFRNMALEYKVVEDHDKEGLEAQVNVLLNQGWKIAGGLSCCREKNVNEPCHYEQTLTRKT
jgi:hypothetical protein